MELGIARQLYQADHLEQILATFGLILIADTLVQMIWGPEGLTFALPEILNGQVSFFTTSNSLSTGFLSSRRACWLLWRCILS